MNEHWHGVWLNNYHFAELMRLQKKYGCKNRSEMIRAIINAFYYCHNFDSYKFTINEFETGTKNRVDFTMGEFGEKRLKELRDLHKIPLKDLIILGIKNYEMIRDKELIC